MFRMHKFYYIYSVTMKDNNTKAGGSDNQTKQLTLWDQDRNKI